VDAFWAACRPSSTGGLQRLGRDLGSRGRCLRGKEHFLGGVAASASFAAQAAWALLASSCWGSRQRLSSSCHSGELRRRK
ncbi:unnamed protein product, partial [Polarella glacialis]